MKYRNTLWPITNPAGVGLANMINKKYPDLINIFPAEVGNLIAENMLIVNSTDSPLNKDFQEIEKNLFELAYGEKWEGESNNS